MTAVWYDGDCDQIWISNREESFPPRTLVALLDGSELIHIRRRGQTKTIAGGPYTEITDASGAGFPSTMEAMAYLGEVFGRYPKVGARHVIAVQVEAAGQASIPLVTPPTDYSVFACEVNGVVYRAPDIIISPVNVTWANPEFFLDPNDTVTVVCS